MSSRHRSFPASKTAYFNPCSDMSKRNLIRNQIRQAWDLTIDDEYEKVLINSERGLQTYFCMHLLNIFKDEGVQRRIFIEPNLKIGEMIRYPDLVVCNTREVIAVIELKYTPRALPRTAKDFETLRWVSEADGEAIIANERFHDQLLWVTDSWTCRHRYRGKPNRQESEVGHPAFEECVLSDDRD